MKLQNVTLENFRAFEHCRVDLGSRLTVLLGENGSGKTAFLDGVGIGLGEIPTYLPKASGTSFRKAGDILQCNNTLNPYARVEMVTPSGLAWDRLKRRDKSRKTTAALPTRRGLRGLRAYLDAQVLDPWNEQRHFDLPVIAYYGVSRAMLDIPLRRRGFQSEYTRFDALVNALDANTHFKSAFAWFYLKENEEHARQKKARSFDVTLPELEAVRGAITRLFPDLSNPHIELNPLRLAVDQGAETLDIAQLSDGYQTLLGLVMDLSSRMAMANPHWADPLSAEAIVLIDEVDLHLHPAWQRRVIGDLLTTFPNTQFVVTTHSPFVVEALNNHLKRQQIAGLPLGDEEVESLAPLSPDQVAAYLVSADGAKSLIDNDAGLIDDQLLSHFNAINRLYDKMRDIEWSHRNSA